MLCKLFLVYYQTGSTGRSWWCILDEIAIDFNRYYFLQIFSHKALSFLFVFEGMIIMRIWR